MDADPNAPRILAPCRSVRTIAQCLSSTLAVAALLAGCTVGPDFHPPETAAPPDWSAAASAPAAGDLPSRPVARPFDGRRWWGVFQDPLLNELVDEAVGQSLDLQTAAARIAEARAQRESAAGAELPTIAGDGVAARSRMSPNGITSALAGGGSSSSGSSGSGSSSAPSLTTNIFQVGFDALWELDLWGKTRRNVEAADATLQSTEQARGEASISLTAEVARTYLSLRGLQRQLAVQLADVDDQRRLVELVLSSAQSGLVPDSDVAQQAVQLAAAKSQVPTLEQNIEQTANRLALLLALPPGTLRERLGTAPTADAPLPRRSRWACRATCCGAVPT